MAKSRGAELHGCYGMQELALRNVGRPPADPSLLQSLPASAAPALAAHGFCGLLHAEHPHECNHHFGSILPMLFSRSLTVYIPVYFASAVAVHRGRLLQKPVEIVGKMAFGMARSSVFLAAFVACAHRSAAISSLQCPVACG